MKRTALIASLIALTLLSACQSEKVETLKSPCVGLDDSPCGPKRVPAGNAGMSMQEMGQA